MFCSICKSPSELLDVMIDQRRTIVTVVEVLLPGPRSTAEKEAFWVEFCAAVEARLRSKEPDLVLGFVELPGENLY